MGNKNSGRKTKAEERLAAIEDITAEALMKLAHRKVHIQLNKILNFQETKEMALPIALKGIVAKTDVTTNGEAIVFMPPEIMNKNGLSVSQRPEADSK